METADVEKGLQENIKMGYIEECGFNDDGEPLYRITEDGKTYVQAMLAALDLAENLSNS